MAMVQGTSAIADEMASKPETPSYPEEIPVPEPAKTTSEQAFAMPSNGRRMNNSPCAEIYDSGCTRHMTPDRHRLINYRSITPKSIGAANQESFSAIGEGDMIVYTPNGPTPTKIRLHNVLYALNMGCTLISISQIDQAGSSVAFQDRKCVIRNPKNQVVAQIPRSNGLYQVEETSFHALSAETLTLDELHRRHGHVAHSTLKKMVSEGLIAGIKLKDEPPTPCKPCLLAKAKKKPLLTSRTGERSTKLGELIYSDVWGPATTRTVGHAEYYVIFVDDAK